jgi:hypothetical protein
MKKIKLASVNVVLQVFLYPRRGIMMKSLNILTYYSRGREQIHDPVCARWISTCSDKNWNINKN